MDGQTLYSGQPPTSGIARKLILELFAGQTVHRSEIDDRIIEEFLKRGGRKSEILRKRVGEALSDLSVRYKLAKHIGNSKWEIYSSPETDKESIEPSSCPEKIIGSGSGSVYVYYYPTYRCSAESRGETTWACKVGETELDATSRIKEQITGMPEKAKTGLVIQTNKPKLLEKIIQRILEYHGKKMPDAPGTEWFITSPREVEDIYQRNFGDSQ